mmetsp:Transcript_3149/g.8696  ORF Transcript_3149/g.8696 Transcript_3149/m.8696 type:complete len:92 (-) Transcript_3149:1508-1783(-)
MQCAQNRKTDSSRHGHKHKHGDSVPTDDHRITMHGCKPLGVAYTVLTRVGCFPLSRLRPSAIRWIVTNQPDVIPKRHALPSPDRGVEGGED